MTTNKIQAAHDAIDRLVTELERQATEHVHALDALRAEVESLRTQNEHLRHMVEESRKIHEANAREASRFIAVETPPLHDAPKAHVDFTTAKPVVCGTMYDMPAIALDASSFTTERGRFAIYDEGSAKWVVYLDGKNVIEPEHRGFDFGQATAWVQHGTLPVKQEPAKPVREVVRGVLPFCGAQNMTEPGTDPTVTARKQGCRQATFEGDYGRWDLYDRQGGVVAEKATEPEAIAWVLDGVLPTS